MAGGGRAVQRETLKAFGLSLRQVANPRLPRLSRGDGFSKPIPKSTTMTIDRRAMLGVTAAALAGGAAINTVAILSTKAAEPDPILTVIARYNEAQRACDLLDERSRLTGEDQPEMDAVASAHTKAFAEVLSATPVNLAGAVAQLRCMASFMAYTGNHSVFESWYEPIYEPGLTIISRLADVIEGVQA